MSDLEPFRDRCRAFLVEHCARRDDVGEPVHNDRVAAAALQRALHEAGLAGLTVPVDYGGQGLTKRHQEIFDEEAAAFRVPLGYFTITLGMCVPVLLFHGTEAQKLRHIPAMLEGRQIWCQMFSEPNAGSDVAAVQMRAVLDGDAWRLNGQKVWTSTAREASFGMCIARTQPEAPKHRGLTMFIVSMDAPGVTVRPLVQATGDAGFSEVFCDDVHVPIDSVLGDPGEGWTVVLSMLMNERVALGASGNSLMSGHTDGVLHAARELARSRDPVVRQSLADLYTREEILRYIALRVRSAVEAGREPGPEGSIAKLAGSELVRRAATIALELRGPGGGAWLGDDGSDVARAFMQAPALSIAGGTSEVQRTILAERVLGLPKEPDPYRGLPFADVPQNRPPGRTNAKGKSP